MTQFFLKIKLFFSEEKIPVFVIHMNQKTYYTSTIFMTGGSNIPVQHIDK